MTHSDEDGPEPGRRPDSGLISAPETEEESLFGAPGGRQRAINLPGIILVFIALFVAVHLIRGFLGERGDNQFVFMFAFTPIRYAIPTELAGVALPGGLWAAVFSPFTHMFLHASWMHLIVNSLWMAAFGAPVARRLGALRFTLLCLLSAAGGTGIYLILHWGELVLLVGASGAVSGLMGAAIRLVFADGMSLTQGLRRDLTQVQALTLRQALLLPRPRLFILVWMGINVVFGVVGLGVSQDMASIAWEAHIGGFFTGLVVLSLLDRRPPPHTRDLAPRTS